MRRAMLVMALWGLGAGASGCASGGLPALIPDAEVPSALGGPEIARVRDVGTPALPRVGAWSGRGDGAAVPGELVVIEGSDLGRLPTVSIGGRAAEVVARGEGGAIVARVPPGVPSGQVEVTVVQPKGRATGKLLIRRWALLGIGTRVWPLEVRKDTVTAGTPLEIGGTAGEMALHGGGQAAYVLAGDGRELVTVDLTAPGGPHIVGRTALAHRASELVSAERVPLLVAIGEGKVTILATDRALRPVAWPARELTLPPNARVEAAALSPDGKVLAILVPQGNRLEVFELFDMQRQPNVRRASGVDLLPEDKLPLVRDLAFSGDGETLWVVSGSSEASLPMMAPSRLTAVRLVNEPAGADGAPTPPGKPIGDTGKRLLSVWRTQAIVGAAAPMRLVVGRGQPTASGTTIRTPPERAALFFTAVSDGLFQLGDLKLDTSAGAERAAALFKVPAPGMVVRGALDGGGGPLFVTPAVVSSLDLTFDSQLVLASAAKVSPAPATGGLVVDAGLLWAPVFGNPQPVFIPLTSLRATDLKPPFRFGEVRIQP